MTIEWIGVVKKVSELKEWDRNPRRLVKEKLDHLEDSIKKFGIAEPLVVNTDNTICGGHGRLEVLKRLKIKKVACWVPTEQLSPEDFAELNIRLNKNIAGEWDYTILKSDFKPEDMEKFGWDKLDLGLIYNLGANSVLPPASVDKDMTEHRMNAYTNAVIKQIVLFYNNDKYEDMLNNLNAIGEMNGLEDNSSVVELLVNKYLEENAAA